jgi:valyl-tRNA synthetase
MNVAPSKKAKTFVVTTNDRVRKTFMHSKVFFATLASASDVIIQEDKAGIADDAVSVVIPDANIYMPFAELVDIEKEKERLEKEKQRLEGEIKRSNGMLNNEKFISKAPEAKVQEEREKLAKYQQMLAQTVERLKSF